jgi:hypothetical protein
MIKRIGLMVALLAHVLLGNLCLMPMVSAEMQPEHQEHMNMTPMVPMSSMDCAHCPNEDAGEQKAQKAPSGCAGSCFFQGLDTPVGALSGSLQDMPAVPPAIVLYPDSVPLIYEKPAIKASPPRSRERNTVVLRL